MGRFRRPAHAAATSCKQGSDANSRAARAPSSWRPRRRGSGRPAARIERRMEGPRPGSAVSERDAAPSWWRSQVGTKLAVEGGAWSAHRRRRGTDGGESCCHFSMREAGENASENSTCTQFFPAVLLFLANINVLSHAHPHVPNCSAMKSLEGSKTEPHEHRHYIVTIYGIVNCH